MSCSCGDPYCDGYNCNNNGGFGIVLLILLYPYLPFMIFGYEIMDKFSNGMNLFKWGGAIIGLVGGLLFYFKFLKNAVAEYLDIHNPILYWLFCYVLSSFMFLFLKSIFPENQVVKIIIDLWIKFFDWLLIIS